MLRGLGFIAAAMLMTGCSAPPAPVQQTRVDPTTEAWYPVAVRELKGVAEEASRGLASGKRAEAAALITHGQELSNRLLAAPSPSLEAMEAASDLDDVYGRMLMGDKRYGWARMTFQKNVTRWKAWKPATPGTEQRLKTALAALAECDKRLVE